MGEKQHRYGVTIVWTGNTGEGTARYGGYERAREIMSPDDGEVGKPAIAGSSDPAFRGDPARWNPEELLIASLSACHQLWYLHLCAEAGIVVTAYADAAEGVMAEDAGGGGQFVSVTLRPRVTISAGSDAGQAAALHHRANAMCFIARSVTFPVDHVAAIVREPVGTSC
ncbi:OsmC family protein [Gluconacetobacter sacchari]|uniref:OsmC family protein n=1 Tax=Gluconacetobacter sacchari TaxID=92759 RepID=UPI0039B5E45C